MDHGNRTRERGVENGFSVHNPRVCLSPAGVLVGVSGVTDRGNLRRYPRFVADTSDDSEWDTGVQIFSGGFDLLPRNA